jgi:glucuronoarabinoxylan endo-1,4-beta-xylanase
MSGRLTFFIIITGALSLCNCRKASENGLPDPDPALPVINITIDKTTKYQAIEGFGFFGAYDVWWESPDRMWNDSWGDMVISDLGITIWRNEISPPSAPGSPQDADWNKQKSVVSGLKAKADKYGVNLKIIGSVWSPPADMKWECNFSWAGDPDATRNPGTVSTKNGGTLDPNKYDEYADWLISHIQLYKDLGVDLYGIGLQNELMFREPYNSCMYTITWYNDMVKAVVPRIKASFPDVKIYGAENMLEMEGKEENYRWFYHNGIKSDPDAASNIDILAVHGYSDGVTATSGSELALMWTNHKEQFSIPMNKEVWMTETSGYANTWEKSGSKPGALNLAMDIHSGLYYGNINAWVWWQGSQATMDEYSIMSGMTTGKKYSVSKHFYRYIRPGAVRVKGTCDDAAVFVTSYEHTGKGTFTIVIINSGESGKSVTINGEELPGTFKMYRTNSGSENCTYIKDVTPGPSGSFEMQGRTIVTLQAGGDPL